jgi:hypothetical protein
MKKVNLIAQTENELRAVARRQSPLIKKRIAELFKAINCIPGVRITALRINALQCWYFEGDDIKVVNTDGTEGSVLPDMLPVWARSYEPIGWTPKGFTKQHKAMLSELATLLQYALNNDYLVDDFKRFGLRHDK